MSTSHYPLNIMVGLLPCLHHLTTRTGNHGGAGKGSLELGTAVGWGSWELGAWKPAITDGGQTSLEARITEARTRHHGSLGPRGPRPGIAWAWGHRGQSWGPHGVRNHRANASIHIGQGPRGPAPASRDHGRVRKTVAVFYWRSLGPPIK